MKYARNLLLIIFILYNSYIIVVKVIYLNIINYRILKFNLFNILYILFLIKNKNACRARRKFIQ